MSVFADDTLFSEFQSNNNEKSDHEEDEENDWDSVLMEYKEENENLKAENMILHEELRKALRIFQQPKQIKVKDPTTDGPIVHVLIFNSTASQKLEVEQVKDFFQHIASNQSQKSHDSISSQPQKSCVQYPFIETKSYLPKRNSRDQRKASKAFVVTRSMQIYNERFYLDQIGEPLQKNDSMDCAIPEYEKTRLDALDGEVELPETRPNNGKPSRCCFNCGLTDHQLKDCPVPKNYRNINQRRQEFMDKRPGTSPQAGSARYHAEKDSSKLDQRFASFKAGVISDELQAALGMSRRDLPPYIYQMRIHGYPPGHRLDAKITGSGINVFRNQNSERPEGGDQEDDMLDVEKLIDYPGFNTEPSKHIVDKCKEHGAMPMDKRQSKDVMVSYYTHLRTLRRRKYEKENEERSSKRRRKESNCETPLSTANDDTREVDMDMDAESDAEDVSVDNAKISKVLFAEESDSKVEKFAVERQSDNEAEDGELQEETPTPSKITASDEEGTIQESVTSADKMDLGGFDSLSESELEMRKEIILKKLVEQRALSEEQDESTEYVDEEEVVLVSSGTDDNPVIDLTSDSENAPREAATAAESSPPNDAAIDVEERASDRESPLSPPIPAQCSLDSTLDFQGVESLPLQEDSSPAGDSEQFDNSPASQVGASAPDSVGVESSVAEQDGSSELPHESAKGLPHRSSFAKGMTQFDAYFDETRSRGVYKKLRGLLKDSPIRQSKKS